MKFRLKRWQIEELVENRLFKYEKYKEYRREETLNFHVLHELLPKSYQKILNRLFVAADAVSLYNMEAAFNLGYKAGKNGLAYNVEPLPISDDQIRFQIDREAIREGEAFLKTLKSMRENKNTPPPPPPSENNKNGITAKEFASMFLQFVISREMTDQELEQSKADVLGFCGIKA